MDSKIISELKNIFNSCNSSDELFDAFNYAIKSRIFSLELYQILLWNKAVSKDEIVMYAGKICSVFPSLSFDIYLMVATIFESYSSSGDDYLFALYYYKKAISVKPEVCSTYVTLSKLYNKDLQCPPFNEIVSILSDGLEKVETKSKIYYALADIYAKADDVILSKKFRQLGDCEAAKES